MEDSCECPMEDQEKEHQISELRHLFDFMNHIFELKFPDQKLIDHN